MSNQPLNIIGMLHAPPLPGSPGFGGRVAAIREHVLRDADAWVTAGVRSLMLENFGDVPFYPGRVPAQVVAHLTSIARDVRERFDVALGINVLRNDGRSALAVAHAVGAAFIRINILCGACVTDQGLMQGIAHELLRDRAALGARDIRIMADVRVKHAAAISQRPIGDEVADMIHRGGADAIIVSGSGTGQPTDAEELKLVRAAAGETPVFVGSGVNAGNIKAYLPHADGVIVGSAVKSGGCVDAPVDVDRVRELVMAAV